MLRRTFWATLTISCVRFRDFPVQLAAFFVESLQDLPHFVVPPSSTQLQVLPVQLQSGASVLYAVVGFPLDVQVWETHREKNQEWFVMVILTAASQPSGISLQIMRILVIKTQTSELFTSWYLQDIWDVHNCKSTWWFN